MRDRLRWLAVAMAGVVALAAALSFAPKPIPAVPPPVRLGGALETTSDPAQNELVIVPAPSVDLGDPAPPTTTTPAPASEADPPAPGSGPDDEVDDVIDDSADSVDDSADSPDD